MNYLTIKKGIANSRKENIAVYIWVMYIWFGINVYAESFSKLKEKIKYLSNIKLNLKCHSSEFSHFYICYETIYAVLKGINYINAFL